MATWKHNLQEVEGDYFFDGKAVHTAGVGNELSEQEIVWIVTELKRFVQEKDGADYLQTYECDDGRKVWCICQLSKSMKTSGDYTPEQIEEYDYWTMLLPEEY